MTAAEACSMVVDLARELADLRGERDSYRLVAREAIHSLHGLTAERDRLRERYHALQDEYRQHRARVMRDATRAA